MTQLPFKCTQFNVSQQVEFVIRASFECASGFQCLMLPQVLVIESVRFRDQEFKCLLTIEYEIESKAWHIGVGLQNHKSSPGGMILCHTQLIVNQQTIAQKMFSHHFTSTEPTAGGRVMDKREFFGFVNKSRAFDLEISGIMVKEMDIAVPKYVPVVADNKHEEEMWNEVGTIAVPAAELQVDDQERSANIKSSEDSNEHFTTSTDKMHSSVVPQCLLMQRSPFFAAMMQSGMQESQTKEIQLPAVALSQEAFTVLIAYLQHGELMLAEGSFSLAVCVELLEIGEVYDLSDLTMRCVWLLSTFGSIDTPTCNGQKLDFTCAEHVPLLAQIFRLTTSHAHVPELSALQSVLEYYLFVARASLLSSPRFQQSVCEDWEPELRSLVLMATAGMRMANF